MLLVAGKNKGKAKGKKGRRFGGSGWGGRKRRQKSSASEDADGGESPPASKQLKSEDKED